jgi:putative (di)nucleoside polyphosphate hydrolase
MTEVKNNPPYRRGVGIMLLNKDKKVFVGQRVDKGHLIDNQAWQMPQGGIDSDEFPLEAAMREVREETGTNKVRLIAESQEWLTYDFPKPLQSALWGGRYLGQTQKWFLMEFLGEDKDIDLNSHHPEFIAWKWVSPEDLPSLIVEFKRDLYIQILKAFESYLN